MKSPGGNRRLNHLIEEFIYRNYNQDFFLFLLVFSAILGFIGFGVWAVVLETGLVIILEIISYLCFLAKELRIVFIGGKLQIAFSDLIISSIFCFVTGFLELYFILGPYSFTNQRFTHRVFSPCL